MKHESKKHRGEDAGMSVTEMKEENERRLQQKNGTRGEVNTERQRKSKRGRDKMISRLLYQKKQKRESLEILTWKMCKERM